MALQPHQGFTAIKQITVTIPSAGNSTAMTLTQNDTTNNPTALALRNTGSGVVLDITTSSTTNPMIDTVGKFGLRNTVNTTGGYGLNISTNGTNTVSSSNGLARFAGLTAADTGPVVNIDNRSSGKSLYIQNNGTEKFSVSSAGVVNVSNKNARRRH
jgi:hypothetical protein